MAVQQSDKKGATEKRKIQVAYREARRRDGLKAILDDPVASRFLWEIILQLGPLTDPRSFPTGTYDTHMTAAQAALQGAGIWIINEILETDPKAFLRFVEESKTLDKEEEGLQDEPDKTDS